MLTEGIHPVGTRFRRLRLTLVLMLALITAGLVHADPTPSITLQPGEYLWLPELAPEGPLVMLVSLPQQLAFTYRNGIRIGVTTVSTGRPGFETPAGVYRILQKRREHYSNRYDDAPMPFMQRLTWDGIALHAGRITGKPASHGCIRLPEAFARRLYDETSLGMTVVVADSDMPAPTMAFPGFFTSIDAITGTPAMPLSTSDEGFLWQPERAPDGPLSIVISTTDGALVVSRQGIEIGRSTLRLSPDARYGLHAFLMLEGRGDAPHPILAGRDAHRWQALTLPVHDPPGHRNFDAAAVQAMGISPTFAALLDAALVPGTTLVVTDDPLNMTDAAAPGLLATDEASDAHPVPKR